jgi:hypothetical protein
MQELGRALCILLPRLPQLRPSKIWKLCGVGQPASDKLCNVVRQLSPLQSLSSLVITCLTKLGQQVITVQACLLACPAYMSWMAQPVICSKRQWHCQLGAPPNSVVPDAAAAAAGLWQLVLYKAELRPSVVGCMTKLKILQLEGCNVLPAGGGSCSSKSSLSC